MSTATGKNRSRGGVEEGKMEVTPETKEVRIAGDRTEEAGEEERPADPGVGRPSPLAVRGEEPGEHEARRDQADEARARRGDMQDAVPAHGRGLARRCARGKPLAGSARKMPAAIRPTP